MMTLLHRVLLLLLVGVWSTNWPILVLPWLAWFMACKTLPFIETCVTRTHLREKLAVYIACLPGLVTLSLAFSASLQLRHAELESLLCIVVFLGPVLVGAAAVSRAAFCLISRQRLLSSLCAKTIHASPKLRRAAHDVKVTARELPTDAFACMVAGLFKPVIILSSETVQSLTEEELRAVLQHERAHLLRRDTLWATAVTFFAECGFCPTAKGLTVYRRSREIMADEVACRSTDRVLLASVLVKSARALKRNQIAYAENFAEETSLVERVQLLLDEEPQTTGAPLPLRSMMMLLIASLLVLYPLIAKCVLAVWLHC